MKHLALLGLALTACTGGSTPDTSEFEVAAASAEGIYRVQSYTRNDQACSPGGESKLGEERFAAVYQQEAFGRAFLSILSCASPADCRAKLVLEQAGEGFGIEFMFIVDKLGAEDQLLGQGASSGFGDGEVCTDAELSTTVATVIGSELRLEQAITIAPDYPVSNNGLCSSLAAQQAAESSSCSQMEVLTATFAEAL